MANGVLRTLKRRFAASLRLRVLALTLAALVAIAIPAAISFALIVDHTTVRLSTLFAERQIMYDRYRGLEALRREVALAETLMRSPTIIEWAEDEFDRDKHGRGLAELEHFRRTFADRSYFFVIDASGNYYFNDHAGTYTGTQQRYTVSPDNPDDSWYYQTLAAGAGCHLNVNHDEVLAVTKVWMNCVVESEGRKLGIVGTGIDLTHFLRNVVETEQEGVESIFIDGGGAIQASRDESRIVFRSLTRTGEDKATFPMTLDSEADRDAFAQMMRSAANGKPIARFLDIGGRQTLVGVGYLDELDWYNVTVMDVDRIVDRSLFWPLALLVLMAMIAVTATVSFVFKRSVLDRLARTERSVERIEAGQFDQPAMEAGPDEIGRLVRALNKMAKVVGSEKASLEEAVRERTEQLERIAYVDQLSGVLNRRGFVEAYEQEERRLDKEAPKPGLLLLDIDNFKAVNDSHGHGVGDRVIIEVAQRLLDVTREHDLCARWGGDEFVVIVKECDPRALLAIGDKILDAIRSRPVVLGDGSRVRIGTSIGAHLVGLSDTLASAASKADHALYLAKRQGRNRMVIYDPSTHGEAHDIGRVA